ASRGNGRWPGASRQRDSAGFRPTAVRPQPAAGSFGRGTKTRYNSALRAPFSPAYSITPRRLRRSRARAVVKKSTASPFASTPDAGPDVWLQPVSGGADEPADGS